MLLNLKPNCTHPMLGHQSGATARRMRCPGLHVADEKLLQHCKGVCSQKPLPLYSVFGHTCMGLAWSMESHCQQTYRIKASAECFPHKTLAVKTEKNSHHAPMCVAD